MSFGNIKELGYGMVQYTVGYVGDRAIVADSLICTRSFYVFLSEFSKGNGPPTWAYMILTGLSLASAYVSCDLGKKIQKQLTRSTL